MQFAVKPVFGVALVLACSLAAAGPWVCAQTPAGGNSQPPGQNKPAANPQAPAPAQSNSNAFPEDESTVPVLPANNTPELPPGSFDGAVNGRAVLPAGDVDPVQSPDDSAAAGGADQGSSSSFSSSSSSSLSGIDSLTPEPDDEQPGKHGRKQDRIAPEHHETAAEDENVGNYYLDNKDWRAALSRFQSAMVLDPDNPDVYWGLAESDRHLDNFADARANYVKVMEYDPGSKHAKEAKKALNDPELVNAKPNAASNSSPQK